jgi:hypothetical protein
MVRVSRNDGGSSGTATQKVVASLYGEAADTLARAVTAATLISQHRFDELEENLDALCMWG